MAEKKKIPAPPKETVLAWQRRGVGNHNLIFDPAQEKWRIVKREQGTVGPRDITYDQYNAGTTTYDYVRPTNKPASEDSGAYKGSVSDRVAAENAISTATITFDASGPIVTFTVPNEKDAQGNPVTYSSYLYVDDKGGVSLSPDDARAGIKTGKQFTFDRTDTARDKHLADLYKIYGNKQAIIDRLFKAGYLTTNKDVPTDAMLSALDAATAQYTVDQVEAYKAGQIKEFSTLNDWLGTQRGQAESKAGTRTTRSITEFSDTDARAVIDDVALSLLQRKPTEQEYAKLVPLLQRKQRKNPQITSTTTDAEGRVVSQKTKTGINEQQFLIERLSQKDEAKANMIMGFYDAFKQAIGVK
jgi:hypothetical protein